MDLKKNILLLLKNEVKTAIGCTEPVAIALCAAAAAHYIESTNYDSVEVILSPNIYKNGMSVGIPNSTDIGLDVAASLGVFIKDYSKGLEVLGTVSDESKLLAKQLKADNKITVKLADTDKKVYVKVIVKSGGDTSEAVISDRHDNIELITLNNTVIFEKKSTSEASAENVVDTELFNQKIMDIIKAIEELDSKDLEFLLDGINMNMEAAELGMSQRLGIGSGFAFKKSMDKGIIGKDLANVAMMYTSAASDARMSGMTVPIMSSNGSGNNGLTAILPIAAYNNFHPTENEKLSRGLAISHVLTAYVKHYIGRLSPLCGCSIAASTGSACAISWLMGGNYAQIQGTVKNILANQSGVICDGAKPGCTLKLGTAASAGVLSSILAMEGFYACKNNGIVTGTAEESIKNLKYLSDKGMSTVDKTIIEIMVNAN